MKVGGLYAKLKKRFNDFRISTKLTLFYFLILILSIGFSSILYQSIYSSFMSRKVSEVSLQTLYSINSNVDSIIENTKNLSKIIISSEEVQTHLKKSVAVKGKQPGSFASGKESIISVELEEQRKMNAYISYFMEAFPYISSIYMLDGENQRYGIDRVPLKRLKTDVKNCDWYDEVAGLKGGCIFRLNMGGAFENNTEERYISLIRVINDIYTQKPIGMLFINISEAALNSSFSDITSKYDTDIMIIDKSGASIVDFKKPEVFDVKSVAEMSAGGDYGSRLEKAGSEDFLISYLNLEKYDWKVISIMPFKELSTEAGTFGIIAFVLILLNSLLLTAGSVFISRMITIPVKKLLKSMKDIEKGRFKKVEFDTGNDEIGKLKDGYNIMISEIQKLIEKVVADQKIQRKAELDILQAQIKPHFLYNTFDSISALAITGRNDEVYKIMKALGSFYRTSLSKGSEVITIGEEVDVVRNYLTIQKVRFGDIFEVVYDIDPEVLKYKILKLILQPIAENALNHGIRMKGEKGLISISARRVDGFAVVAVEDDGVGMDENEVLDILSLKYDRGNLGYGLMATIERLRIFYGEEDLLTIESKKGSGTRVVIRIPVAEVMQGAG